MLDFLIGAIVNALLIVGVYEVTQIGQPLHFIRKWLDSFFVDNSGNASPWYYPILYCPLCMSSMWGVAYYAAFGVTSWLLLPIHVLAVFALLTLRYD